VVSVASPPFDHHRSAMAALAAGKHVLCEVPLALAAAEAERVAAAAAAAGRVLLVCHTQRFWAPVAHLRALVEAGELDVQHVVSRTGLFRRENVGWTGRRRSWVDSVVWHHGSHAVDTALHLLGAEPERVAATAGRPHPETGRPMDVSIALRTATGSLATLALSYNSRLPLNDLVVIGEQESYRTEGGALLDSRGVVLPADDAAAMQAAAIAAQNAVFLRAVETGAPAEPSAAGVLPVYRALQEVDALLRR